MLQGFALSSPAIPLAYPRRAGRPPQPARGRFTPSAIVPTSPKSVAFCLGEFAVCRIFQTKKKGRSFPLFADMSHNLLICKSLRLRPEFSASNA